MNCDQARERIVDRWICGIDEAQRMELDQHLAGCADCRDACDSLNALWNGLGDLPMEEPSRTLRSNFRQMMEAYRLGAAGAARPASAGLTQWLKGLWPRQPLLQFATAGAALVFGIVGGHLYTVRGQDQQRIAQLSTEVRNMRQLVALSLLQQQSASDRLRGVSYSVRMEPADEEVLGALLATLSHDGNVNVRLAALDALKQFGARMEVRQGLRQAMLHQESPLVQIALIDWAVEARDRGALEGLLALERRPDLHPAVRSRVMNARGRLE